MCYAKTRSPPMQRSTHQPSNQDYDSHRGDSDEAGIRRRYDGLADVCTMGGIRIVVLILVVVRPQATMEPLDFKPKL